MKRIDLLGQIICIAGFLLFGLMIQNAWFLSGYFVVGGWQLLSALLTYLFASHMPLSRNRQRYLLTVFITGGLLALSFLNGTTAGAMLFIMLLISPAYAVWYVFITHKELSVWEARAFVHLR